MFKLTHVLLKKLNKLELINNVLYTCYIKMVEIV